MRGLISAVLKADPEVEVVGQAGNAMEARAAIKQLNPDVVTLDIEMPEMNGLEFRKDHATAADAGHHGLVPDAPRRGCLARRA